MRKSRFTEEQIVGILQEYAAKQADAPTGDAFSIPETAKDWRTGPHVSIADVIAPFGDPQKVAAQFWSEEAAKAQAQG